MYMKVVRPALERSPLLSLKVKEQRWKWSWNLRKMCAVCMHVESVSRWLSTNSGDGTTLHVHMPADISDQLQGEQHRLSVHGGTRGSRHIPSVSSRLEEIEERC